MANERKTEIIVRNRFYQFLDTIEEKSKSENLKITGLLPKTASKNGSFSFKPEFIITYKKNSDLIIAVECKADITKHESKTGASRNKYFEYGVAGLNFLFIESF